MHFDFLKDLLVAFALGGAVVYALRPLKVPSLVGLLLAGAVAGPHGFSLIDDTQRVEMLAEIGVVLLLFTVGLEFSLSQLLGMWRTIVGGGAAQVGLTIGAVALVASTRFAGFSKPIFLGFLVAMSSTVIVLRMLGERGELEAPQGRISFSVLLFQDLSIVPLMLLVPLLAGHHAGTGDLLLTLLKASAIVVGVLLVARKLVPVLLYRVVRTRSRELFLILLIVLCLGTAWVTSLAGLPLALGAFLAGLAVSESEFSHQALAEAVPFRDAFGGLFFLSVGMLMDAHFVLAHVGLVGAALLGIIVIKVAAAGLPTLLLGYPVRVAIMVGFCLAQVGEFSFVLAHAGLSTGLLGEPGYQLFLSASVGTMLLTPLLMRVGRFIGKGISEQLSLFSRRVRVANSRRDETHLRDHVIIVGYGMNGRNLARTLRATEIPYTVLEMNPQTVRSARQAGEPIHYGDCTREEILTSLGVDTARVLVIAISDAASARAAVSTARARNPQLRIVVRTRFISEVDGLRKLGANQVIPEEFETSIEIFSRVLACYAVPHNVLRAHVAEVRSGMYEMLRAPSVDTGGPGLEVAGLHAEHVDTLLVRNDSPAIGRSLTELDIRKRTGASVLAIRRGNQTISNPDASFRLQQGDVLVVLGHPEQFEKALAMVDAGLSTEEHGNDA